MVLGLQESLTSSLVLFDSLELAMNQSQADLSYFGLVVEDCKSLLAILTNCCIRFVKRSANQAAHCLARVMIFLSNYVE